MTTVERSVLPMNTDEQETLNPDGMQFNLALICQVASLSMHILLTYDTMRGKGIAPLSRNQSESYLTNFQLLL